MTVIDEALAYFTSSRLAIFATARLPSSYEEVRDF